MIDLHCHLLPGIDDGPGDLAATVALARALVADGTTRVVATPHVSPEYPNTSPVVAAEVTWVRDTLAKEGIALDVLAGGELDLAHVAELDEAELARFQLGESGTLLVECPLTRAAPFFEQRVAVLQRSGLRVLLAHPERSPVFQRDRGLLARLVAGGAMASLTASSFAGRFGRTARAYAEWALDEQLVHDVASDAHDVRGRPPAMRDPLETAGYGWAVDWLTLDAPAAILAGARLPARPSTRSPKRGFLRAWR